MKLLIVGCEYAGTTTLAHAIDDWMAEAMGSRMRLIHDHWKVPYTVGHPANISQEEERQFLALSPWLKDNVQRHNLYYHAPRQGSSGESPDKMVIGMHIDDAIYGPRYFGYGGPGEQFDRRDVARKIEHLIVSFEPETVLVLVKASRDVIARRMKGGPPQKRRGAGGRRGLHPAQVRGGVPCVADRQQDDAGHQRLHGR